MSVSRQQSRVRYVVMAFLCALSFLTYFDRVCIVQAQHDIQQDLHLTDQQIGLVLSTFWLAYALFEIPSGWLGDRYGARGTLTRVVIAWSLFTGLSGAANGFVLLLAFGFLFGAGEAGAYPNMAKIQQVWLPLRSRGRAGGLLWLAARWGGAFSPIIFAGLLVGFRSVRFHRMVAGVPLLNALAPWRLGFFVSGMIGLIWVVSFFFWFRNTPAEKASVSPAELKLIRSGRPDEELTSDNRRHEPVWRQLFASPSLWAMGALYFCGSFGWNFFVSWMPRFFLDVHDIKFEKSAIFSGLPLFFGGIACLAGGYLSDLLVRRTGQKRWGRAAFPIAGCVVAATSIFCVRFTHSYPAAVALMCLTACAFDFGQGANWAALIDIGGRHAGTSTGFINSVGNIGNALQGMIGAWIFTHYGWDALFGVYAAAYLIAGSMWLIIDPRKTFYRESIIPSST